MKLELYNGSYFIFDDKPHIDQEYVLQMWLYHNGFEGNIERRPVYTYTSYFSHENQYNTYDNPYYMGSHQEIGYLLNYRYIKYSYTNNIYETGFIKYGTCIISADSHLLFLNPGEYEILQSGLKILPNE